MEGWLYEEGRVICCICKHGDIVRGTITSTFERNGTTVVIKSVPAGVCNNCGEEYLEEVTTAKMLAMAEVIAAKGSEVEVVSYAAA